MALALWGWASPPPAGCEISDGKNPVLLVLGLRWGWSGLDCGVLSQRRREETCRWRQEAEARGTKTQPGSGSRVGSNLNLGLPSHRSCASRRKRTNSHGVQTEVVQGHPQIKSKQMLQYLRNQETAQNPHCWQVTDPGLLRTGELLQLQMGTGSWDAHPEILPCALSHGSRHSTHRRPSCDGYGLPSRRPLLVLHSPPGVHPEEPWEQRQAEVLCAAPGPSAAPNTQAASTAQL